MKLKSLAVALAERHNIKRAVAYRLLEDAFAEISASVENGEAVAIPNFGKFVPAEIDNSLGGFTKKIIKFRRATTK